MASQSRRQKRQMLKTLGLLGKRTPSQKAQVNQIMDLLSKIGTGIDKIKSKEAEGAEIVEEAIESEVIDENINEEADGTK
jgi:hypothetical protein